MNDDCQRDKNLRVRVHYVHDPNNVLRPIIEPIIISISEGR